MVAIRVDANTTISTGQIMRCITVAKALRSENVDVVFITADSYPEDILKYL